MERLAGIIIKLKWVIISLVFLVTIFLGYQIRFLTINSDVISSLPDTDKDAILLKYIGEKFGGNKIGMVILEADDIFNISTIENISRITQLLSELDGVSSVTSLTNIIHISSGEYGLEVGNLIDEYNMPQHEEELAELRDRVLSDELYNGFIVSDDGRFTTIIFSVMDRVEVERVAAEVKSAIHSLDISEKVYYAGAPMLIASISGLIASDLLRLIPISFVVIILILYIGFKSKRGTIIPLLTCAVAILWTMGLMSLAGFQMTMVSNNIPILLLAVGSAYSIHVLNRLHHLYEEDRLKAMQQALAYLFVPIFLAAITTMAGFLSFIFGAYLTMIKEFGLFTALGTFFSAFLALFFIPALSAVFPDKSKAQSAITSSKRMPQLTTYFLSPLNQLLFRHPKYILSAWGILILLHIGGIFLIQRNVNIKDYFRSGNPIRVAEEIMEEKFGGTKPVFVLFHGDMQSPEVLSTMYACEDYMKQSQDIQSTQSVAGLISQLHEGLGEGRGIPDDQALIEQLWFLIEGNEMLDRLVTPELDQGIIISKFISSDDNSKKDFQAYMNRFIEENSTEDCRIEITGMPFIDVTMNESLLRSQIGSLLIAIVFVIIIVGLILRSIVKGLLATLPMIAAILLLFGFMGFASISLNIGTVLAASVVLGIGIDYSIHVISSFNYWINRGAGINKAIEETILVSGKAIVINVGSVTAGFLVLIFSELLPLQNFGLLIGLSMIGSGLGAMTLLPVILILINRKWQFKTANNLK